MLFRSNCGSYIISATDACGVEGTFDVRSSSGQWRKDSHACTICSSIPDRNCTSLGYCDVTAQIFYSWYFTGSVSTAVVVSGRFKAQVYTSMFYANISGAFNEVCPNCRNDFFGWATYCYYNYFGDYTCASPCNYAFLAQCADIVGIDLITIYYAPNGSLSGATIVQTGKLQEWVCL